MKKTLCIIAAVLMVASPCLVFAVQAPTDAEYDEAASIAGDSFICDSLPDVQMKILQYEFIKKPAKQKIAEICTYGSTAYVLREETSGKKMKMIGGMFIFAPSDFMKMEKFLIVERTGHLFSNTCELQDTTQAESSSVDYLCYNPAVAAGSAKGVEYSFDITTKKTSKRNCTVNFGGKNTCGKWKKLK